MDSENRNSISEESKPNVLAGSHGQRLQLCRFGKPDVIYLSLLGVLLSIVLLLFYCNTRTDAGSTVTVTVDGNEFGRYALSEDRTVGITDAEGNVTNVLQIRDGYARMAEADCPDQLCVHQKPVSREKENLVCLPNRVVVTVTGGEAADVDAVVK